MDATVFKRTFHLALMSAALQIIGDPFGATMQIRAQDHRDKSTASATPTEKRFEFEVASIRLHKPGTPFAPRQLSPDGYRSSMSAWDMINMAYSPLTPRYASWSKIKNAPPWIRDMYDINARISEKDMAVWQQAQLNDQILKNDQLERSALRAVLEEHFKLVVQVTPIEVPYLNLIVSKSGPKLTDTVPGAVKPVVGKTRKLGDGFFIENNGERRFVGVSMKELANWLTSMTDDLPVQDKTGLTGRYDFTLPWYGDQHDSDSGLSDPLGRMPLKSIGLQLKKGKGQAFNFDIKHIEKPDEN
jgi:uncharacterized protein (TIGR03435 family)